MRKLELDNVELSYGYKDILRAIYFKAEFGNRALLSLNFKSSCRCLAFVLLKTWISIKMRDVRL